MIFTCIENIFLFHGKGGRPTGSVLQLEELLLPHFPEVSFTRPGLLHSDPAITAEESLESLCGLDIPQGSAIIGISLGGLLAAKLQEVNRADLHVVCISSPTWADKVEVSRRVANRIALYSSRDEVILGRTSNWPELAKAYDLPWLTHDTDVHKVPLVRILESILHERDVLAEIVAIGNQQQAKGEIA